MTRTERLRTIKFIQKTLYTVPFCDIFVDNTYKKNNKLYIVTKGGDTIPISRYSANFFRHHGVDGWYHIVINKEFKWI
jgi:hypothetical protein